MHCKANKGNSRRSHSKDSFLRVAIRHLALVAQVHMEEGSRLKVASLADQDRFREVLVGLACHRMDPHHQAGSLLGKVSMVLLVISLLTCLLVLLASKTRISRLQALVVPHRLGPQLRRSSRRRNPRSLRPMVHPNL